MHLFLTIACRRIFPIVSGIHKGPLLNPASKTRVLVSPTCSAPSRQRYLARIISKPLFCSTTAVKDPPWVCTLWDSFLVPLRIRSPRIYEWKILLMWVRALYHGLGSRLLESPRNQCFLSCERNPKAWKPKLSDSKLIWLMGLMQNRHANWPTNQLMMRTNSPTSSYVDTKGSTAIESLSECPLGWPASILLIAFNGTNCSHCLPGTQITNLDVYTFQDSCDKSWHTCIHPGSLSTTKYSRLNEVQPQCEKTWMEDIHIQPTARFCCGHPLWSMIWP